MQVLAPGWKARLPLQTLMHIAASTLFSGVTVYVGLIMRIHRVLDLLNFTVCSSPWALCTFLDKSWEAVADSLRLHPAVCKWTQWHASQPRSLPTSSIVVICIVHRSIFVTWFICSLGASCEYEEPNTFILSFLRWQVAVNGLELTQ